MALKELALILGMEVSADDENKVKSAVDRVKQAAKVLAGIWATVSVGKSLWTFATATGQVGDETLRTAQKLGITTDALQEQRFAAQQVDVSHEELAGAYRVLTNQADAAAHGSKQVAASFKALGVNVLDNNGKLKSADVLLKEVADGLMGIENGTRRAALAGDVLGRSGANLIPMLANGSAGLEEMAKKAHEMGNVLGVDVLEQASAFDDASDELTAAIFGLRNVIGAELLPYVTEIIKQFRRIVGVVLPVAKVLGVVLRDSIQVVSSLLNGLVRMFKDLHDALGPAGDALGALSLTLAALGVSFGVVGKAATVAGLKAAWAWVVATAPLALTLILMAAIAAAILLVIDDLVTMGEGGESVIGSLIQGWSEWYEQIGSVTGLISEILFTTFNYWAGLSRETWDAITADFNQAWEDTKDSLAIFVDTVMNFFMTIYQFVTDIFTVGIERAFFNLWENIKTSAGIFVQDMLRFIKPLTDALSWVGEKVGAIPEKVTSGAEALGQTINRNFSPAAGLASIGAVPVSGGRQVVNQNETNLEVHVNAPGATAADAKVIGAEVGSAARNGVDTAHRQALQAYATVAAR